jgi:hypothetical protein
MRLQGQICPKLLPENAVTFFISLIEEHRDCPVAFIMLSSQTNSLTGSLPVTLD